MSAKHLAVWPFGCLLCIVALGLGSCGCEPYVLVIRHSNAVLTVYDNQDYNADSTQMLETLWKPSENEVLGNALKLGMRFQYTYSHDPNKTSCDPTDIQLRDSVLAIDIISLHDMEGIDSGQSVLAAGGWPSYRVDSLRWHLNTPFYPNYSVIYLKLKGKSLTGLVQFKAIVTKNNGASFEVLSDELEWK
ncbi:MAG: hypothetical protein HYZ16_09320 [Bacteroidetes bacterium]|jgi:hypothetical protein|nr:hypothetical protein [Bacteroidota bacterium]